MKEPILVVLAAGMGSRYGGLKQIDPVGPSGEVILNYTCYDAIQAGFKRFIFIIKEEMLEDFKRIVSDKLSGVEVNYVFQTTSQVPASINLVPERIKPLGTTHALYCCKEVIDAPFAICNADDFYGRDGFKKLYQFLTSDKVTSENVLIGYELMKTLSDNGSVTRGICKVEADKLVAIEECSNIREVNDQVLYTQGEQDLPISKEANVSMNMWGFNEAFMQLVVDNFEADLQKALAKDPMKGECLIPVFVGENLANGLQVGVTSSVDRWFGVTYQEDKPAVKASINALVEGGVYPKQLF